jgi:hypothetical protein
MNDHSFIYTLTVEVSRFFAKNAGTHRALLGDEGRFSLPPPSRAGANAEKRPGLRLLEKGRLRALPGAPLIFDRRRKICYKRLSA